MLEVKMYYKPVTKQKKDDDDDISDDEFIREISRIKNAQKRKLFKIKGLYYQKKKEYSGCFTSSFKDRVKRRDGYRCQFPKCIAGDDLTIHHIDYNKKNTSDENCITLCRAHNAFVNKLEERKHWQDYFRSFLHYQLNRGEENGEE
jgi:hypothetical protein